MGSDHRTTSLAVDGPRAAATDGEAKAIKSLLIRDIKDFDQSVPAVVRLTLRNSLFTFPTPTSGPRTEALACGRTSS